MVMPREAEPMNVLLVREQETKSLALFASLESLEAHVEPIDIENGESSAWDCEGRELDFVRGQGESLWDTACDWQWSSFLSDEASEGMVTCPTKGGKSRVSAGGGHETY
jgi:hypothetical protein